MIDLDDNKTVYIGQHFKNINLSEKEIFEKEFDNCEFHSCNFSEAAFLKCKFYECNFVNCNLSMIKIRGSSFFDTTFEDSKAIGINWTQAAWPRIKLISPISFYKCILNHSSFFGLSLREMTMVECLAKEIDLREADFTGTDFSKSLFGKIDLTKANFSDAQSYNIDIFNNKIKKARFSLPEAISLLNSLEIELLD